MSLVNTLPKGSATLCATCLLVFAARASGQEAAHDPAEPARAADARPHEVPRLHHAPRSSALAREPVTIRAMIEHPELIRRALLVYFSSRHPEGRQVAFARADAGYVARIPGSEVELGRLGYTIELELLDGQIVPVFASRKEPHPISVWESEADARERALLDRFEGRRSSFSVAGDFVDFGMSQATLTAPDGTTTRAEVHDRYYRVEGGYTYRVFAAVAEFSLRAGIVRGNSPVPADDQEESERSDPFDVGLNYGSPSATFRLSDALHLETELLASVTEEGFAGGAGATVIIGDPYGAHLRVGGEAIETFGSRFFTRLDVAATRAVMVSPMVEVTNMPHADEAGVRLLCELSFAAGGGFGVRLRGGYQARHATSGGVGLGGGLSYAF